MSVHSFEHFNAEADEPLAITAFAGEDEPFVPPEPLGPSGEAGDEVSGAQNP